MKTREFAVAAVLLLAACGDPQDDPNGNTSNNPTNNAATNGTTSTNNVTSPDGAEFLALAASSDFATSAVHVVEATAATETPFGSGDVAVAVGTDRAFGLDRSNGLVQVFDPAAGLSEVSVIAIAANLANPHDAVDAMGKVYISLYNGGSLVVATPNGDTWAQVTIDLAVHDDFDQNPEPSAMAADGGFVLVVLQRLQDFVGVENSLLLVIDASDDSEVDAIDLGATNVQAGLRRMGSGFAVGATGDYGVNDGGIIAITRNEPGDYAVGEMLVDEAALGGDLLDFVFVTDTRGYAVITLPDFSSQLLEFEVGGAVSIVDTVVSPGFGGLDIAPDGRWLAVGDRDPAAQGFVLFDLDAGTHEPIPTTLPPASFRFMP